MKYLYTILFISISYKVKYYILLIFNFSINILEVINSK